MKNKLNALSGKDWLQYSFSIWRDIKRGPMDNIDSHPASFPVALPQRIIRIFTNPGDWVLDPFMGSGSTAIAALIEQRNCCGVELSKQFYEDSKNRISLLSLERLSRPSIVCNLYQGNSLELEKYINPSTIDLCVTSPPYWDILNRKRSADKKPVRNYSDSDQDLGNIIEYDEFLEKLGKVFSKVWLTLKKGGYCVVIVMDVRKESYFYPLHSDISSLMKNIGYEMRDIIIWDRQKEYNNMRPLGYPYSFIVNKVHEYVLIFRKGEANGRS
ncbi:MAG: site-specific DNA-methyltransferase [Nitrososphaerota archaeon]